MRLRQIISEWEGQPPPSKIQVAPDDLEAITMITAGQLIDSKFVKWHKPFIYCPQSKRQLLYTGPDNSYHHSIMTQIGRISDEEYDTVQATYSGKAPGAVGRIGRGLQRLEDMTGDYYEVDYPELEIVAFYNRRDDARGYAAAAVKGLLKERLISGQALVTFEGYVIEAQKFAQHAIEEPELTRQEVATKPTMQTSMKKAGIIGPGQRWWAPTSESTRR